jgi:hypothetical protein
VIALLFLGVAWAGARGVLTGQPPPEGLDRAYEPRRVALVVGIDSYRDPALGMLRFAAKDAADLASTLRDPAVGDYDVVSEVDGDVPRAAFWDAFDAVAAGIQRDDTVLVYIAAHGTLDLDSGTELFVIPSDGWLSTASQTGVSVADLSARVEALPARRKVLILDTCYSGSGRSAVDPAVRKQMERMRGPVPAPPALRVSEYSAHLYAAHVNQPALEDPGLQNGVYTHFLLEALRGAGDVDGDGLVEVMEAHDWARDRTLEFTGGTQVPWAETTVVGREAIYLAGDPALRRTADQAILTGLERLPLQAQVSIDGLPRGAGPIQEGSRALHVTDGDETLLDARVRVAAGEEIRIDRLVDDRAAHVSVLAGAALGPDRAWLGSASVGATVLFEPADVRGVRPVFGAEATFASGSTILEAFPAGTLLAWAGPELSSGGWRGGPSVGAGEIWRFAHDVDEAAPVAAPGLWLARTAGHAMIGASAESPVFLADNHWNAVPRAGLWLGWRP